MFNAKPNNYNLQNFQELVTEKNRTVKNVLETISHNASQLISQYYYYNGKKYIFVQDFYFTDIVLVD